MMPITPPVSLQKRGLLASADVVRGERQEGDKEDSLDAFLDFVSPLTTPTPVRRKDGLGLAGTGDLTWEILEILEAEGMDVNEGTALRKKIEDACGVAARRNRGVVQS
jgi:hypothetical protein